MRPVSCFTAHQTRQTSDFGGGLHQVTPIVFVASAYRRRDGSSRRLGAARPLQTWLTPQFRGLRLKRTRVHGGGHLVRPQSRAVCPRYENVLAFLVAAQALECLALDPGKQAQPSKTTPTALIHRSSRKRRCLHEQQTNGLRSEDRKPKCKKLVKRKKEQTSPS